MSFRSLGFSHGRKLYAPDLTRTLPSGKVGHVYSAKEAAEYMTGYRAGKASVTARDMERLGY